MYEQRVGRSVIRLVQGDITKIKADVIVNAANAQLVLGGGVAGAIRREGGPSIQEECDRIGGTSVGNAVITGAGSLQARYVIHAVGPRMGEGDEDLKLRNATLNSLKLADKYRLTSIVFPAISTGIFGYPRDRCAKVMISTVRAYLRGDTGIREVIFCLYDEKTLNIFHRYLEFSR
ncbi:MAG: macro domain-containing protein [Candidatus Ranarchaeia archaeon]